MAIDSGDPGRVSRLQLPFLRELADSFCKTSDRIVERLATPELSSSQKEEIVRDELRGLFHGVCVTFDGGSALADEGLVSLIDDEGVSFERCLHEKCLEVWPSRD